MACQYILVRPLIKCMKSATIKRYEMASALVFALNSLKFDCYYYYAIDFDRFYSNVFIKILIDFLNNKS